MRHYLLVQWQLYLYCIPATSYETHLMSGTSSFQPTGPLVLCLLPQFPQVALEHGASEGKIVQLAGQVMWLVRSRLCTRRKISVEEKEELTGVITAWGKYMPPFYMLLELDKMERNNFRKLLDCSLKLMMELATFPCSLTYRL